MTLGEVVDRWLEIMASTVEANTERGYRWVAEHFVKPAFGDRKVASIRTLELDQVSGGSSTLATSSPRYARVALVTPARMTTAPARWSGPLADSRYQPGDRAAKWSSTFMSQLALAPATNSADPHASTTADVVNTHGVNVANPIATDSPRCMDPCISDERCAVRRCRGAAGCDMRMRDSGNPRLIPTMMLSVP